jgi:hypothetical protein
MSFRDKIRMKNSWSVWHKDFISFFLYFSWFVLFAVIGLRQK